MQYTNFPTQFAGFNTFNPFNQTTGFTGFATPWATPSFQNGFAPAWNSTPSYGAPSFQNACTPASYNTPWYGAPSFQNAYTPWYGATNFQNTTTPFGFAPAYTPAAWAAPQFATPGFAPEALYNNAWCAPSFNSFAHFNGYQGFAPASMNSWNQTPNYFAQGQFGAAAGFSPVTNPWNYSNGYSNGVYGAPVTQGVATGFVSKTGVCREAA